ncbi:MAG: Tim44/TimA family putative adaptor protein [Alphaproteobacteria bacterium]|nr:Tim44/TimA family putative adaptor protein [Alphaproteobacteria bacterium]
MNDGTIDVFTLIALIAAVVVVLKLRSVLGRRTEDDDARIERQARERELGDQSPSGTSDNVVTLPRPGTDLDDHKSEPSRPTAEEIRERIQKMANNDPRLTKGLESVLAADPEFDPDHFIDGAKQAYELIVTAFAEGNLKVLRDILSDDVYRSFAQAVKEREKDGVVLDQTFVGINKANVLEAEVADGAASVVVRFGSEMISVTRDESGEIKAGDPNQVEDITDIWTFSRDVSTSRARANPNWQLVATQAPN